MKAKIRSVKAKRGLKLEIVLHKALEIREVHNK